MVHKPFSYSYNGKKLSVAWLQTHKFVIFSQVLESDSLYDLKTKEVIVRRWIILILKLISGL
jgi:hypothetical protein